MCVCVCVRVRVCRFVRARVCRPTCVVWCRACTYERRTSIVMVARSLDCRSSGDGGGGDGGGGGQKIRSRKAATRWRDATDVVAQKNGTRRARAQTTGQRRRYCAGAFRPGELHAERGVAVRTDALLFADVFVVARAYGE